MKKYNILVHLILATLLISSNVSATSLYTLGTSKTGIYLIQSNGTEVEHFNLYTDNTRDFTGIAMHEEFAFVADASSNKLLVFKTSNLADSTRTIEKIKEIHLYDPEKNLKVDKPQNVVATKFGGVYVTGSRYLDNKGNYVYTYSYLLSPAKDWGIKPIINLVNSPISDIDIFFNSTGYNAIFTHQKTDAQGVPTYRSHVTITSYGYPLKTIALGSGNSFPIGITVNSIFGENGYAYIASRVSGSDPNKGSLAVVDCSLNMSQVGDVSYTLDMIPLSLTTFNFGSQSYLGMVTTSSTDVGTVQEIWKITLDSNGLPTNEISKRTLSQSDHSTQHKIVALQDGSIILVSNPTARTVTAIDTNTWTPIGTSLSINDPIFKLANINF